MESMHPQAKALLAEIGALLNSGCYPVVHNGGIVRPSKPSVTSNQQGVEMKDDERTRQRRPATGPWQGTAGGQGQAIGSWPSRRAAPVIDPGLQRAFEAEIDAIRDAYPGTAFWLHENGVWLRTESQILDGLTRRATFLTSIPFTREGRTSSWGYWTTPISASWIGPRHTNFPDGSVCAFERRDGTWNIGDNVVTLLDLYTLWALRHLYMEVFGRWPGYQSVPMPYERLQELKDDEFCGCDKSNLRYAECCKPRDLMLSRAEAFQDFLAWTGGTDTCGMRRPPNWAALVIMGIETPLSFPQS